MKNKILLLFLFIAFSSYSQGLKLINEIDLNELPTINDDALGFVSNLPSSYSFEKYVPPVMTQKGASCVGFASLYYGLSTMYNIKFNITESTKKFSHSFDPYFIYSIIKSIEGKDCEEGSYFNEALDLLKKTGAKKMLYPPFLVCNSSWDEEKFAKVFPYSKPYSIENWGAAKVDNDGFLEKAKKAIYFDHPLIFGIGLTKSFYSLARSNNTTSSSSGLWSPSDDEQRSGGHAMTIVGYDDYKFGGAFRVVNSWGKDYGDNGYLWIKYSDFIQNVKATYIFFIDEEIDGSKNPQIDKDNYQRVDYDYKYSMEGQLEYKKFNGYGIYHSQENKTSYIGNFTNGNMDGYFLMVNKDGLFESTIRNGEFIDFDKLGFGDEDSEVIETRLMAKKYFNQLDNKKIKSSVGVKKIYSIID
tara:strand:- start:2124 stop:3365 length:1242 start_codon:yes stop_codon:yes gene_type:complete